MKPVKQEIPCLKTFAAIDFETANKEWSSVCSVGIVIVKEQQIVEEIYSLIRPTPNYYNWFNIKIHGIKQSDTSNAPEFPQVWAEIAPKIEGLPLVAHNSQFDEGCLKAVHKVYGLKYARYKFYCTCNASRRLHPDIANHKLHTVAAHCGHDLENHHNALADAEACARIAMKVFQDI